MKKKVFIIIISIAVLLGLCAVGIFVLRKEKPIVKPSTIEEYLAIMKETVEDESSDNFQASISEGFYDVDKEVPYSLVKGTIKKGKVDAKIVDKKTKKYSKEFEGKYSLSFEENSKKSLVFSKINPSDCEILDEGYSVSCKSITDSSDDTNVVKTTEFYTFEYNDRFELSIFKNYNINYESPRSISEVMHSEETLEKLLLNQTLNSMNYEFKYRTENGQEIPSLTFTSFKIIYGEMSNERKYLETVNDTLASNKQGNISGIADASFYYSENNFRLSKGTVINNLKDVNTFDEHSEISFSSYKTTLEGSRQIGLIKNTIFASNEFRDKECRYDGKRLKLTCNYFEIEETTSEWEKQNDTASYTGTKTTVEYIFNKKDEVKDFTIKVSTLHLNEESFYKSEVPKTEEEFHTSINEYIDLQNPEVKNNKSINEDVMRNGYGGSYVYYEDSVSYDN